MVQSPSKHTSFDDVNGLIEFVELIACETGLPVGIKAAVGQINFGLTSRSNASNSERA